MAIQSVSIIGGGRVGGALARRFHARGLSVRQVYGRSLPKAIDVADPLGAEAIDALARLDPAVDLYLLAVPDDAIAPVAGALAGLLPPDRLLAHCSGATPSTVLTAHFPRAGIFYPCQSFAAGRPVDWETLPLCVHAARTDTLEALEALALRTAKQVYRVADPQRAALHVAAVIVNNFTNHLYGVAEGLTAAHGLPFELLLPLIRETTDRLGTAPARTLQTGPARRGDHRTVERHLALLAAHPEYRELYRVLTRAIARSYGQ